LRLTHLRAKRSGTSLDLEEELGALGRESSGLRNAIYDLRRERAEGLGGDFEVGSRPGRGTEVTVRIHSAGGTPDPGCL
jgi:signal transduction histidine kinase